MSGAPVASAPEPLPAAPISIQIADSEGEVSSLSDTLKELNAITRERRELAKQLANSRDMTPGEIARINQLSRLLDNRQRAAERTAKLFNKSGLDVANVNCVRIEIVDATAMASGVTGSL